MRIMETIMIIGIAIGVMFFFAVVVELTHISVFGKLRKEAWLNGYFIEGLDDYDNLIGGDKHILVYDYDKSVRVPFIAKSNSTLSKWYIQDIGTIPRWSKWSKKLDEHRLELLINKG